MCCGDMGILVVKGKNGKSYPYILVGIIESSRRNQSNYEVVDFTSLGCNSGSFEHRLPRNEAASFIVN